MNPEPDAGPAVLQVGFRPFFLAAMLWSLVAMGVWLAWFQAGGPLPGPAISPISWHAHEMIYGYAMAVVAGFLLTAVREWTGLPTPSGPGLAALLGTWIVARVAITTGQAGAIAVAAAADLLFGLALALAVTLPVVRARKWRQLGITAKVWLLLAGNTVFYAAHLGANAELQRMAWLAGLYLLVALVLTLGTRLIPLFIGLALGKPRSAGTLDRALGWLSAVQFVPFFVLEVFTGQRQAAALLAALGCAVHGARVVRWYAAGIGANPLLWSLLAAYLSLAVAFALYALEVVLGSSGGSALHAFAIGGIGLMTVSMMARVTLGHTGRNVRAPDRRLALPMGLVLAAALARAGGPLLWPAATAGWIIAAQVLWLAAFAALLTLLARMLISPRLPPE